MTARTATTWALGALILIGLLAWGQAYPEPCHDLTGEDYHQCVRLEYP